MKKTRLWDSQGSAGVDEMILRYTSGEDYLLDEELVPYDLKGTEAHAKMLKACGYLSQESFSSVQKELHSLAVSHINGEWHLTLEEEDCHTAIENRLTEATGEAGRSIHLARSRNDQVLAALRLWLKDQLKDLADLASQLATALETVAEKQGDLPMPGYTHLQRAMPSTVRLWALGFAAEFRDDAQGLISAMRRADKSPLGSAAGYGVPILKIDPAMTGKELGFAEVQEPVTSVQISRGKAEAGSLFEAALLAQDLGKLASDLCLFSSAEFAFVRLPSQFTTGSSIMPQKRNPDVFELARGRSGEAAAALSEVLGITSKLTSGYHRDLQLIKKPLFRGLKSVRETAEVVAHAIPQLVFDETKMREAMDPSLYATEEAYRMVAEEGVSFRDAYGRVKERISTRTKTSI